MADFNAPRREALPGTKYDSKYLQFQRVIVRACMDSGAWARAQAEIEEFCNTEEGLLLTTSFRQGAKFLRGSPSLAPKANIMR